MTGAAARASFAGLAAAALASCTAPGVPRAPAGLAREVPAPAGLTYEVRVEGPDPGQLSVLLTLTGGAAGLSTAHDAGIVSVEMEGIEGIEGIEGRKGIEGIEGRKGMDGKEGPAGPRPISRDGGRFRLDCPTTCRVRYHVDLGRAAALSDDDLEVAVRAGPAFLAPAATWLLHPDPIVAHVPVRLTVRTAPGIQFASGLRQAPVAPGPPEAAGAEVGGPAGLGPEATAGLSSLTLESQELTTAGFTAFGTFHALRAQATGGYLDVAVLGGERVASDALLGRWVTDHARALDGVYGRFPVTRAQLFLFVEGDADEVSYGVTMASGGASLAVRLGSRTGEADLYDDWILEHELFHLGVPSFWQEGRWIDEGLATYYEPLLRTRAHLRSERALWRDVAFQMPLGLPPPGDPGLARAEDHDRVYWGGALVAFQADLLIRRATGGARSLDDGLRAVLAHGGDATRLWSLERFFAVIDEATGTRVMADLLARASGPGEGGCEGAGRPFFEAPCLPRAQAELDGLFAALGVEKRGNDVALVEDAPLASLRRRLGEPSGRPQATTRPP